MSDVTTATTGFFDWRRPLEELAKAEHSRWRRTRETSPGAARSTPKTPAADTGQPSSAAAEDGEAREVRRDFWGKLVRSASAIPFAEDAAAAYFAAFDTTTPLKVRAALVGVLAYFILPVDAVPDVVPMLGFSDDAALLMGAVKLLAEHITPAHRAAARARLDALRQR